MKKLSIVIAVLVLLGGAAFVLLNRDQTDPNGGTQATSDKPVGESGPGATEPQADNTAKLDISGFAFAPASITVKKGTAVTWTNKDSAQHTVTPDEASDAFAGSELLAQGESYTFTFDQPGTYAYHCQPHPQMTGKVIVTE